MNSVPSATSKLKERRRSGRAVAAAAAFWRGAAAAAAVRHPARVLACERTARRSASMRRSSRGEASPTAAAPLARRSTSKTRDWAQQVLCVPLCCSRACLCTPPPAVCTSRARQQAPSIKPRALEQIQLVRRYAGPCSSPSSWRCVRPVLARAHMPRRACPRRASRTRAAHCAARRARRYCALLDSDGAGRPLLWTVRVLDDERQLFLKTMDASDFAQHKRLCDGARE